MSTISTSERQKRLKTLVFFLHFWPGNVLSRHNGVHFFDLWTSKSGPNPRVLYILTWKCASRHNGVHFFDISTSKSGPNPRVLYIWLGNVLRATTVCTFSTSQLPKVVQTLVLCTFWLGNVLRATTASNFSRSQLPKVVRTWGVFSFLTYKCASRHNGVQFFTSHLASWVRIPTLLGGPPLIVGKTFLNVTYIFEGLGPLGIKEGNEGNVHI